MASVLNRSTKVYLTSVNTPDYPILNWIHNPDLGAVVGFPSKYWSISGDTVSLMSQTERDAVDLAELNAQRDGQAAQIDDLEGYLRAFALVLLDELNGHADKINAILTAIDNGANLSAVKTNIAAIADYPQRTVAQLKTALRGKLGV